MEYNNKEYNNKLRCVILPKDANVENFEEIEIDISSDAEVRVKQFGMLSELYYLYAKHNIFTHYDINKTYEEKKIPALDYIDEIYENILLLRFIYCDLIEQEYKDENNIIKLLSKISKEIDNESRISDKIHGELLLNINLSAFAENVKQSLTKEINKYYNEHKIYRTNDKYLLKLYFGIIDCFKNTENKNTINYIKSLVVISFIQKILYK